MFSWLLNVKSPVSNLRILLGIPPVYFSMYHIRIKSVMPYIQSVILASNL